jgi:hypothetical protein
MPSPTLSRGAVKAIHAAVENVFNRLKGRVLGPDFFSSRGDKRIYVGYRPEFSLPGIYKLAAAEEASKGDDGVLHGIVRVAESYLDAQQEATKARVVQSVNAWISDAARQGKTADLGTVLAGELAGIWTKTLKDVVKVVDTESTTARNLGTLDGVSKTASALGIEDPSVYFVVVRDKEFWECGECPRLHLLPDRVTPRVWKLSEVSGGYHKHGDDKPCLGGLHPHCRCTLASLMPGYGFDDSGRVRFVSLGYDEFASQHG